MRDSERRYQEIFEHTPVALWEEDFTEVCARLDQYREQGISDWREFFDTQPELVAELASVIMVQDVNEYALTLYQAESKEQLLTSIDKTFDPQSFAVFKELLLALTRGERLFQAESYARTLRGERLQIHVQLRLLEPKNGQIRGLASLVDISRRKKMEASLREMNSELEESNKELEHFAYMASHDLQEPLRMISSYTELLARRYQGQLDERADKYIHYIIDGARRMQSLVSDLLELSRVGTKGRTLRPIDSTAVLMQILRGMRLLLEENNAEVTYDQLPTVVFDPPQLGQLFQNLIANAVKFRREAPPRVHISAHRDEDMWVISVQDNGIGIAPDSVGPIFEVFKRLHARDEYPGTGVGLAIAKKIVERHGGEIWLESTLGEGTTFFFTTPSLD